MFTLDAIRRRLAAEAARGAVRFADLFCEQRRSVGLHLENGRLVRRIETRESGWGLRRLLPERIELECCEESAPEEEADGEPQVEPELEAFHDALRQALPEIIGVRAEWQGIRQVVRVGNTTGAPAQDVRRLDRLKLTLLVERRGRRTAFSAAVPWPMTGVDIERLRARMAADLESYAVRAGEHDVILPPGAGAVFFHETVGHALEADAVVAWARVGERISSESLTVVDDGILAGGPGSLAVTDEGFPPRRVVLIDRGRVVGRIFDCWNGEGSALPPAGGRRESFRCLPLPRMTNLLVEASEGGSLSEIIADTRRGVLAGDLESGRVDLVRGDFSFFVPFGRLVENGRLGPPVAGLVLHGRIADSLARIDRIGSDFEMARAASYCVKAGQTVRVGIGQPTVRICRMGVTEAAGRRGFST